MMDGVHGGSRPPHRAGWFATLASSLLLAWWAATPVAAAPPTARAGHGAEPRPTEFLEGVWPGHPEWLAMLAEILAGNQIEPGAGWYKKGVARSRFDWTTVRDRFDRDRDGKVGRGEFPGPSPAFRRLDRDGDGSLTGSDIGRSVRETTPSRVADEYSLAAFGVADRNGDSKVSGIELQHFLLGVGVPAAFEKILASVDVEMRRRLEDAGREGFKFLVLCDFQEAFAAVATRDALPLQPRGPRPMPTIPVPKETLLRSFLRRDIGAWGPGPALEASAPDFTLETSAGRSTLTLSKLIQTKPVVLIFGNHTNGNLRHHVGSIERLRKRHEGLAHFVLVYTRESHPVGGWELEENRKARITQAQPRDYRERVSVARWCRTSLGLEFPVLVDTMDDRVGTLYSGMPIRMYLIDRQGKVAYKGGRGPYGFKPAELEQSLIFLQADESTVHRPDRAPDRTKSRPIRGAAIRHPSPPAELSP